MFKKLTQEYIDSLNNKDLNKLESLLEMNLAWKTL